MFRIVGCAVLLVVCMGTGDGAGVGEGDEPLQILHQQGLEGQTRPHSGYIDPRQDVDTAMTPQGLQSCLIRFNRDVYGCGDGLADVSPDDFEMVEPGFHDPPHIVDVSYADGDRSYVRVEWSRPITPKRWSTVVAYVCDIDGNAIDSHGDLGSSEDEPDRVDFGFVSCDIDQNGYASPLDLFRMRVMVNNPDNQPFQGKRNDYVDIDRDGEVAPLDIFRFRQLKSGILTTQPWSGALIEDRRP